MSLKYVVLLGATVWIGLITVLHASLNLHYFDSKRASVEGRFRVGFLPVT